jgi:hypothetical protein
MVMLWAVTPCGLGTNVSEGHTASIFRAEVRSVRKWIVHVELGKGQARRTGQSDPKYEEGICSGQGQKERILYREPERNAGSGEIGHSP